MGRSKKSLNLSSKESTTMFFALLRNQTLKPRALPQIYCSLSRACYHGTPQYNPMKDRDEFFAPTDYPEEPPDLVVNSKKRVARWNEADATLSEASVKADRDPVKPGSQVVREKWKIAEFEKNKEPELDEM